MLSSYAHLAVTGHSSRAINRYALKGRDLSTDLVKYEDRDKDGRSNGYESKASKVRAFLKKNSDQALDSYVSKDLSSKQR